ncbi:MAG TPA: 50S ribosomal protein L10 [Candidatus Saccharimonadia bacterium]|jgi:large subunit ribosomal protein L10|nr:50S ribosomal protein L10 [Candidatus Saccharimonadia bacterium]
MAISRNAKEQAVDTLTGELGRIKLAVMTDYRGLSVREVEELRGQLRDQGISYRVTKNTLLRLAAKNNTALAEVDPGAFKGPMALAMGFDDEVAPARVIFQYAKTHDALEIVGAITGDGQLLTAAQVKALATLPSREQLLAQVVGTIAAPLTGFVGVMAGNVRSIINVLNALSEAKA